MFKHFLVILGILKVILCDFTLLLLHNNDIHGHFEETFDKGKFVGGIARQVTLIKQHRKLAEQGKYQILYLNGGDTFQGTIWYIVWRWEICADFLNLMKPDAQCLGNHEFDRGLGELEKFVSACTFPTLGGNVDFSKYPSLVRKLPKSVVVTKGNRKIGIIGYVTQETSFTSQPEVATFQDEITTLTKESKRLHSQGVNIIIALGHSGEQIDKEIAKAVPHVDIVVGSHSHYLYWSGPIKNTGPGGEKIMGPYPLIVKRDKPSPADNLNVPIVTAFAFSKYLGKIILTFDDKGKLLSYRGAPIFLNTTIPKDSEALKLMDKYRPKVDEERKKVIGELRVNLVCHNRRCRNYECNCGNMIVDAFVFYRAVHTPKIKWTDAPIAILNAGTIMLKSNFTKVVMTRADLLEILPNGNKIVVIKLKGKHLKEALEHGVSADPGDRSHRGEFLQVSGIQYIADCGKKKYQRVTSVKVRCGICKVPVYKDLDLNEYYNILTTGFLMLGADGHNAIKNNAKAVEYLGKEDEEVVKWYFEQYSPIYAEKGQRITIIPAVKSSCFIFTPTRFAPILIFVSYLLNKK